MPTSWEHSRLRTWWKTALLLFDKRTPGKAKLLALFLVVYGFSPFDAVPDLLPLVGQLDDLALLVFTVWYFLQATKKLRGRDGNVIEVKGVER